MSTGSTETPISGGTSDRWAAFLNPRSALTSFLSRLTSCKSRHGRFEHGARNAADNLRVRGFPGGQGSSQCPCGGACRQTVECSGSTVRIGGSPRSHAGGAPASSRITPPTWPLASPRKTSTARLSRRISSSSNLPMRSPAFDFGMVAILSIITRCRSPLRPVRFEGNAEQRRIGAVSGKGADDDRVRRVETIVLQDDGGTRLASIVLGVRDGPDVAPPHSSPQSDTASMKA